MEGSLNGWRWQRRFRWALASAAALTLSTCIAVEPMRWRLPNRYLFQHLDIHRTGFGDYTMCLRAAMTEAEARSFVNGSFAHEDQVARVVPMEQTQCPASFWPGRFKNRTMGLRIDHWPNGMIEGSDGAVYEDGYLYFWSNTM